MLKRLSVLQSFIASLRAGAVAATINGLLFYSFHSAGVISDNIHPTPHQPLTIVPVVLASILPTIMASQFFYLFENFTKNGFRNFTIVSLIMMVLSLYTPFNLIPGATIGYSMVLALMHVVVTVTLLYFIRKAKGPLVLPLPNTPLQTT